MAEDKIRVPFHRASITEAEENAVLDVLRSGWLTTGKRTLEFERKFSEAVTEKDGGAAESVRTARKSIGLTDAPVKSLAVNSNTSGMLLAMEACGVGPGKSVLTTPYTFVSTAACARHLGADVVFADIEKDSYSIDSGSIERILSNDTGHKIAAVVPVHVGGNVCRMDRICAAAKKHGAAVIEDAAHAFPSPTSLGYAGTVGDAGVFSFYATKTITTAEGGMVCTRNPELARRMETMRMHGMDRTAWDRYTSPRASWEYDIVAPGYKFNLPDILSAIGICQLERAERFHSRRKATAEKYNRAFSGMDFVSLPPDGPGNSWHLYLLRLVPEKLCISRQEFAGKLQQAGIGISVHFIPLFHFSYWKALYPDFTAENFPNAERQYSRTISIPIWPDMTDSDSDLVIETVARIGKENHA